MINSWSKARLALAGQSFPLENQSQHLIQKKKKIKTNQGTALLKPFVPIFGNLEIPRQKKKWLRFQECPGGVSGFGNGWEVLGMKQPLIWRGSGSLWMGEKQGWRSRDEMSVGCGERRETNPKFAAFETQMKRARTGKSQQIPDGIRQTSKAQIQPELGKPGAWLEILGAGMS